MLDNKGVYWFCRVEDQSEYTATRYAGYLIVMSFEPCHVEYDLTRRQRLIAHLGVWSPYLGGLILVAGGGVGIIALSVADSLWFLMLIVLPLWLVRGFIVGFLNVIFVPVQHMEIFIEENALGYATEDDRLNVFLDGIIRIQKYSKDTWTISHYNGTVISIPVNVIEEQYIDHMRKMAEWGKTPEGVQAEIDRGKRIQELVLFGLSKKGFPRYSLLTWIEAIVNMAHTGAVLLALVFLILGFSLLAWFSTVAKVFLVLSLILITVQIVSRIRFIRTLRIIRHVQGKIEIFDRASNKWLPGSRIKRITKKEFLHADPWRPLTVGFSGIEVQLEGVIKPVALLYPYGLEDERDKMYLYLRKALPHEPSTHYLMNSNVP